MPKSKKIEKSGSGRSFLSQMQTIKEPESVSVRVANQLRDMIVTGKIALGEQLSENALAQVLGVSRTPVREAFMKLEAEKMVEVRPKRGTFVFTCNESDAREIGELRSILEKGAIALACQRDRSQLVERLSDVVARSATILRMGPQAFQPLDIEFHNTIFEIAHNKSLTEAYERIAGRVSALRYRLTNTVEQVENAHATHIELVNLLRDGRDDEVEKLIQIHVHETADVIEAMFRGDMDHLPIEVIIGA
ncbi:GntR family transcriptional regulator [uncultured Cohaesibacter sp.]|uniref:GntR family transcriptional regulator n=1 Tax=uncultured Cohaesibacter sp. TaxID=1002546 RepID=UPI0029C8C7FD|nr:GntR family transcriptional regulator [uncultured Cohaesibacter sp.]